MNEPTHIDVRFHVTVEEASSLLEMMPQIQAMVKDDTLDARAGLYRLLRGRHALAALKALSAAIATARPYEEMA